VSNIFSQGCTHTHTHTHTRARAHLILLHREERKIND